MFDYSVKVRREKTYLWGGEDIARNLDHNFFLVCRVEDFGEKVELKSIKIGDQGADPVEYGIIRPGESYIVPLKGISGVSANTQQGKIDSTLVCTLIYLDARE